MSLEGESCLEILISLCGLLKSNFEDLFNFLLPIYHIAFDKVTQIRPHRSTVIAIQRPLNPRRTPSRTANIGAWP